MAGTNAVLVKSALLALIKTAITPVRIDDAYKGRDVEREYVYFGHITIDQEPMVFRNGVRQVRQEDLTIPLHVEVSKPGATTLDTDTRVTAIGQLIEEALAADPTQAALAVPGLMGVWVTGVTLTSFYASDGEAASELVYTITAQSKLG
jgi:hypothetical protein